MKQNAPVSQRQALALLVIILLAAAMLRITGVASVSPPGIEHDEVAHWLISRDILDGSHGIYFAEAYGHEAGFHYVQTLFLVLMGDNILVLRLASIFAGMLLVSLSFALARTIFDVRIALISAALVAVLLWPVFYSRLALRAISLPLLSGISLYFWWQGWKRTGGRSETALKGGSSGANRLFISSGIFAGLSLYTYMAARSVPIFYLFYSLYLLIFHRSKFQASRRGIGLFFLSFLAVSAPLAVYLLANPGVEARLSEVNQPLTALFEANFRPVLSNIIKIAAGFGISGDPLWRQNIAYMPVFEPLVALFFYIGAGISLWRFKQPRYTLITLWLLASIIPSVVTIDAPSSIRIINALPVIAIFPAIGLEVIHYLGRLSTVIPQLSPKFWRYVLIFAFTIIFLVYIGRSVRGIFMTWPADEEVRFVWQEAFADSAAYLDNSEEDSPTSIGGWTPDSMDPPTMELSLKRDDLDLRFFDPTTSVIVPAATRETGSRIIRPSILPLEPSIEDRLIMMGASSEDRGSFTIYEMESVNLPSQVESVDMSFGEELLLLGYEWNDPCDNGGSCELLTYWQVLKAVEEPRSLFLHLVDSEGAIISQDDGMGAVSDYWQEGDLIVQHFSLDLTSSAEAAAINLGLYQPLSGERKLLPDGSQFHSLNFPGSSNR